MRSFFVLVTFCWAAAGFAQPEPREPGPHPPSQQLKNPFEFDDASVRAGRQVWVRDCAVCHGMDGRGQTEMLEFLATPPPDFTRGDFKYGITDGEIYSVIRDGTNYDMPPFDGKLPEARMWHVVNFIRSLISEEAALVKAEMPPAEVLENPFELTPESIRKGQVVWRRDCAVCHGMDGRGHTEMLEFLTTPPPDFTKGEFLYGDTDAAKYKIIRDGTPNDMTAFGEKLSTEDIWHVVNFMKSLEPEDEDQAPNSE